MSAQNTLAAVNRNPLNMRPSGDQWLGMVGVSTNPRTGSFLKFKDNPHGVRAAVINMRSIMKPEKRTIRKVINGAIQSVSVGRTLERLIYVWAPIEDAHEGNHTENYLQSVMKGVGLDRDADMTWLTTARVEDDRRDKLIQIVKVMNLVEAGGATVNKAEIIAGIDLALGAATIGDPLPEGYVKTPSGNIVNPDVKESTIVKDSNKGLVLGGVSATGVTGIVADKAIDLASRPNVDWVNLLIVVGGVVIVACIIAGMVYVGRIKGKRIEMSQQGIV